MIKCFPPTKKWPIPVTRKVSRYGTVIIKKPAAKWLQNNTVLERGRLCVAYADTLRYRCGFSTLFWAVMETTCYGMNTVSLFDIIEGPVAYLTPIYHFMRENTIRKIALLHGNAITSPVFSNGRLWYKNQAAAQNKNIYGLEKDCTPPDGNHMYCYADILYYLPYGLYQAAAQNSNAGRRYHTYCPNPFHGDFSKRLPRLSMSSTDS